MNRTIDIKSDQQATKLIGNFSASTLRFGSNTKLTLAGAKAIAEAIRQSTTPTVSLHFSSRLRDDFIDEVTKIIYLDGNKPEMEVHDERSRFELDCLQLQHNDKRVKEYSFTIGSAGMNPIRFGTSLCGNKELQRLEVNLNGLRLQRDVVKALAAGICNSQLTELCIYNKDSDVYMDGDSDVYMDGEIVQILLEEGILASRRVFSALQIWHAYGNLNLVVKVLPFAQSLSLRCLMKSSPPSWPICSIIEAIGTTNHLFGLDLYACDLDDEIMTMLSVGLRNHISLTDLKLQYNKIGDAGIISFVENWPRESLLKSLNLCGNNIGPIGAEKLIKAVAKRHAMESLNLCDNPIGLDGLHTIGVLLPTLRLKRLNLENYADAKNNIRGQEKAGQSVLLGIQANFFLHNLEIRSNFDCRVSQVNKIYNTILFYAKLNKFGRHLLLANVNDLAPTLWCYVIALCGTERCASHSLIFYFLMAQPSLAIKQRGGDGA